MNKEQFVKNSKDLLASLNLSIKENGGMAIIDSSLLLCSDALKIKEKALLLLKYTRLDTFLNKVLTGIVEGIGDTGYFNSDNALSPISNRKIFKKNLRKMTEENIEYSYSKNPFEEKVEDKSNVISIVKTAKEILDIVDASSTSFFDPNSDEEDAAIAKRLREAIIFYEFSTAGNNTEDYFNTLKKEIKEKTDENISLKEKLNAIEKEISAKEKEIKAIKQDASDMLNAYAYDLKNAETELTKLED